MWRMRTEVGSSRFVRFFRSILRVGRAVAEGFRDHECPVRAAAVSYYAVFSLFPLLLFLIFLGSLPLASQSALQGLYTSLERVLPSLSTSLEPVIEQTLRARGSIGLVGAVGFIYSASAVFAALSVALNVIWGAEKRSFFRRRLLGLVTVLLIGVLFLVSIGLSAVGVWIRLPSRGTLLSQGINLLLDIIVTSALFWLVYRSFPNRRVNGRAALQGAAFGGFLWTAAKAGFGWYLTSGLPRFGLVYGSLASMIVLIIWVYLSVIILLLGAELAAAVERASTHA